MFLGMILEVQRVLVVVLNQSMNRPSILEHLIEQTLRKRPELQEEI